MDDLRSEVWRTYTKHQKHITRQASEMMDTTRTLTAIFRATWSWDPDNLPALTWQQRLRWFYCTENKRISIFDKRINNYISFSTKNQTLHICINICILCTHLFRKGTDTTSLSLAVMTKWSCLPSGYCSSVFAREGLEMICPKIGFSWFFVMWCHQAPL